MFRITERLPPFRNQYFYYNRTVLKNRRTCLQNSVRLYDSIPPPEKKGGLVKFLLYSIGGTALLGGGVIAYAKYDQKFRKKIEEQVPGADTFIKFVLREDKSYLNDVKNSITNKSENVVSSVYKLIGKNEKVEESKPAVSPPPPLLKTAPKPTPEPVPEQKNTKPSPVPAPKPSQEEPAKDKKSESKREKSASKSKKPDDFQRYDISKLEIKVIKAANKAISAFNGAITNLQDYREEVTNLIEKSVQKEDHTIWFEIKERMEQKEKIIEAAEKTALKAMKKIEHLKLLINESKIDIDEESKRRIDDNVKNVLSNLVTTQALFYQERRDSSITDKFSEKVEKSRQALSKELGIIFPSLVVDSETIVTDEELDLFILYTCQLLNFYQKELKKLETIGEAKIQKIIEQSMAGNPDVVKNIVDAETEKQKRDFAQDLLKQELKLKVDFEKELVTNLKRQAEVYQDLLDELVTLKDKEAERTLKQHVDEKLDKLQIVYNQQLARVIGRMKGLETVLNEKIVNEKLAKHSQLLWNASQSLLLIIKTATSSKSWEEQLRPLENEVSAILKAAGKNTNFKPRTQLAENDELVEVVIASIPKEARTRGVFSEMALKDRFLNVEKIAYRLANLPEGYVSMPSILLSYLQSFLLVKLAKPIPADELMNEPFDVSSLNNYDILNRARYWLDRGDFLQALKYMNLLKGAARAVASEWINETRIFLETQQAARVLLSHAAWSSLVYLKDSS